jgi:hypothetical protein
LRPHWEVMRSHGTPDQMDSISYRFERSRSRERWRIEYSKD